MIYRFTCFSCHSKPVDTETLPVNKDTCSDLAKNVLNTSNLTYPVTSGPFKFKKKNIQLILCIKKKQKTFPSENHISLLTTERECLVFYPFLEEGHLLRHRVNDVDHCVQFYGCPFLLSIIPVLHSAISHLTSQSVSQPINRSISNQQF